MQYERQKGVITRFIGRYHQMLRIKLHSITCNYLVIRV